MLGSARSLILTAPCVRASRAARSALAAALAVTVLTAAAAALAAAPAHATPVTIPGDPSGEPRAHAAAEPNGRRWPGRTITYHESPKDLGVRGGAKAWNRSGVNIRFKRVSQRSRADVLVSIRGEGCAGFAQLGWGGPGTKASMVVGRCARYTQTQISAHEFGHILGLGHENRRCALMNPVLYNGAGQQCTEPPMGTYRCRTIEPHDLKRAKRMYGGKPKVHNPANCPLFSAPEALEGLRLDGADSGNPVLVASMPASPKVKVDIGYKKPFGFNVQLGAVPGACPADLGPLFREPRQWRPIFEWRGEEQFYVDVVYDGSTTCYAVRIVDELGRIGPARSMEVTLQPPPEPPHYEEPPPEDPYQYGEPPPEDPYYYEEPPPGA